MAVPNAKQSTQDLLEAQAHICHHTFKFINTMSLKCAVELNIPNIIHEHNRPITLTQLAHALSINKAKSQHLHRLMRVLVHSNFFVELRISDDNAYWLTLASRLFLKDNSFCITPLLEVIVDPIMQEPWHYLSQWFLDGYHNTPFETAHGTSFWEYAERVPRFSHLFNEAMASEAGIVNHVVLGSCKDVFRGFESLVDVGGGVGATVKGIADEFPEMRCVVFDLPHVVAGLEGRKNLKFVGGDMFEGVPCADVVLLQRILHDWNDEDSVRILRKCKDAIGSSKEKGGKVIVIDTILNNDGGVGVKALEDQLLYDMAMMTYLNGKERNEEEWAKIFSDAGFSGYNISLGLGIRSLIEVYP